MRFSRGQFKVTTLTPTGNITHPKWVAGDQPIDSDPHNPFRAVDVDSLDTNHDKLIRSPFQIYALKAAPQY